MRANHTQPKLSVLRINVLSTSPNSAEARVHAFLCVELVDLEAEAVLGPEYTEELGLAIP